MARTKQTARKREDDQQPATWVETAKRAKTEPAPPATAPPATAPPAKTAPANTGK